MRALVVLLVGLSLFSTQLFAEDAPTDGLLPLHLLEAARTSVTDTKHDASALAVSVGRLDENVQKRAQTGYASLQQNDLQWPYRLNFDGPTETLTALNKGTVKLQSPSADQETVLWVKTSMDDNLTCTVPVSLSRRGNTLTLVLEHWFDNGDRDKSIPKQYEYLIPAEKLAVGEYELRVAVRSFLKDATEHYAPDVTRDGTVKFSVSDTAKEGPALPLKDPQPVPGAPQIETSWLLPHSAIGSARSNNHPNPGVYAGTLDAEAWQKGSRLDAPTLTAPTPIDNVYALVVGPELNSGESMRLQSILWDKKASKITLLVELWRDDGPRRRNVPSCPTLLVPLVLPFTWKDTKRVIDGGTYTVAVEWTALRAKDSAGPYNRDSEESFAALKKFENTRTVTIGADPKIKAAAKAGTGADF